MSAPKKDPHAASTPQSIEADLAARRSRLTGDFEELGLRLAPSSLKTQAKDATRSAADQVVASAKDSARAFVAQTQDNIRTQVSGLLSRAGDLSSTARGKAEGVGGQAREKVATFRTDARLKAEEISAQTREKTSGATGSFDAQSCLDQAAERVERLFDDAKDGEPRSLAIVTGAALGLAGLSIAALTRTLRA